ncbi:MAG: acyl-CoA dehydrogenase [Bacteroidota bacterium]
MPSSAASSDTPVADLSRGAASVLPFLYVAWADGLLVPSEMEALRARVRAQDWLSDADRDQLCGWLDPQQPPDATTYFGWVRAIRRAARHIPDADEKSLAELGVELATLAGEEGGVTFSTPEAHRALEEMEAALGIVGHEVVRDLVERTLPPSGDGVASAEPVVAVPPSFDIDGMSRLIDGPRTDLRRRVLRLLRDDAFRRPDPDIGDPAYREIVLGWTKHLAEQGIGALAFPDYAGGEGDIGAFIAALETISFHDLDLAIKFGVQFGLFGGSINQLGSEAQKKKYLADVGTLDLPGCFAMTERRHGSNVRDLQTTATLDRDADEWVIETPAEHDHKAWIGNAAQHGRMATVFAQLVIDGEGFGVHAFLVPIRGDDGEPMPGIRIADSGHKMGLNGVDNGRLWFSGVRIPRENLLSRFARVSEDGTYLSPIPSASKRFFVMLGTLVGGRIAVASGANSAAKCGLEIAVRYGDRRKQFGPAGGDEVSILDYLSHQRRLLPLVATSYGLTFALHDLAERFAAMPPGADTREAEAEAAALKAMASWHGTRSLQEAREACGGEGFRWTSRIASRKADSDIFTTFEGDNTVLQLQVAKGLLAGYRQEFEDLNAWGLLRYVRDLAETRFGEINPLARRDTDKLHDAGWHAALFERRERQLLVTAARRLKRRLDQGMDSFDAFVEVQDHLLTLASAHAERLVHDRFRAAVDATEDEHLRSVLDLVCTLYALWHIEQDRGWFLEQGVFEGTVAKAIRTEVNALLHRLRPLAVDLVAAWGIPEEVLASDLVRG